VASPAATDSQKANCGDKVRSTYLLGPEDELQISGPELDELSNKTVRVDGEGDLQVPLVGRAFIVARVWFIAANPQISDGANWALRADHPSDGMDFRWTHRMFRPGQKNVHFNGHSKRGTSAAYT